MTPQNARQPLDEHALITRIMEMEMKEHVAAKKHHGFTKGLEHEAAEKAYGKVIRLIKDGRGVRQKEKWPYVPIGGYDV